MSVKMKICVNVLFFLYLVLVFVLITSQVCGASEEVYIVYMGHLPKINAPIKSLHLNVLQKIKGSNSKAAAALIHSYQRSFNGFVAKLNNEEKEKLSEMEGVVSVFRSETLSPQTTRSWDFLGMTPSIQNSQNLSDVIVGMLDYGISPDSESFKDDNFSPPPKKWKGICMRAGNFSCNNKIVGARFYVIDTNITDQDIVSPQDSKGHGTHTASTVAGAFIDQASFFGLAAGTARGGVPSARLAIYKVCWSTGCSGSNVLAAFDDAIADGVDMISASIVWPTFRNYFQDPIAIGSFHAHQNGILTSASAGNFGPKLSTIRNFAPWLLSVGASSIDRAFVTPLMLGNGEMILGASANTFDNQSLMHDIVQISCKRQPINATLVKGKISLCLDEVADIRFDIGKKLKTVAAVGAVIQYNFTREDVSGFPIPASFLTFDDASRTLRYLRNTSRPTGLILKTIQQEDASAPTLANFSSRGPNPYTVNILKPDLTAPGVNILAAWPISQPFAPGDDRRVAYNFISGTSMACPHASAVAAYIKSVNPDWSPSAIMSAMITTATPVKAGTDPAAELGYGAGQINPVGSLTPGLVYKLDSVDFLNALCGEGYPTRFLQLISGDDTTCTVGLNKTISDLNYPSFTVFAPANKSVSQTFLRKLSNVAASNSTYEVTVVSPPGFSVQVEPTRLSFQIFGETLSFRVILSGNLRSNFIASGSLAWNDGTPRVRSPIVVHSIPPIPTATN